MLQNYDVDITEFLSLTNSGLKVADFVQVKAAIIKRYKETYGSDIDLSTASADGIFVNDLALIINNILKTVSTIYANLDVNSASGAYLDILCRLSNVKRKLATNSRASLLVTNIGTSSIDIPAKMEFFDKAGTQWTGTNRSVQLEPNETIEITAICSKSGAVKAEPGYISQAVDASLPIEVKQREQAEVGTSDETDDELRERRAQSNGAQGVTVLESLYGALRQNAAITDVKIYNNASNAESSDPLDGTIIGPHDIYVILRQRELTELNDASVGQLIYEKLTPGISTTKFTGSTDNGESKEYTYIPSIIGHQVELFQQSVYWKRAKAIAPSLSFTIRPMQYFDVDFNKPTSWGENDLFKIISDTLIEYMNSLPLGTTPTAFDIQAEIVNADPLFKTRPTFNFVSVSSLSTNPDTYYGYTGIESIVDNHNGTYTITLK